MAVAAGASHDDDQQGRNLHRLNAVTDAPGGAQAVARPQEAQALFAGTRKTDEVSAAVAMVVHCAAHDGGNDHDNDFGYGLDGHVLAQAWEAGHKTHLDAPRIETQEVTAGLIFLVDVEVSHMVRARARAY